jgi:hypothetical protein
MGDHVLATTLVGAGVGAGVGLLAANVLGPPTAGQAIAAMGICGLSGAGVTFLPAYAAHRGVNPWAITAIGTGVGGGMGLMAHTQNQQGCAGSGMVMCPDKESAATQAIAGALSLGIVAGLCAWVNS